MTTNQRFDLFHGPGLYAKSYRARTMAAWLLLGLVLGAFLALGCRSSAYEPRDGDIVFHTSRSSQSQAIQLATHSKYSHMGIVYLRDGKPFVYEAVQPVKLTPLAEWIARGKGGHFVAKRLKRASQLLDGDALARMREAGKKFKGKSYDLYFDWSDDRVYCSELVWKIYHRALGISIGELETIGDFDLSAPVVQEKIRERWGTSLPRDEAVISPASMFSSHLLKLVHRE